MRRFLAMLMILALISLPAAASEELSIDAKGAVLIDAQSGRVLFARNENRMLPMASCTKIMTALLALENASLDEEVTAGKNAHGVTGTSIYLSEGETLTMEQMLYGLMLRSGNDAAVAIAEHISGSVDAFARLANERARELDADANFANPHGLDAEGHAASALGLARIMREAMRNPSFRTITSTQKKIIPWVGNEYSRVLENKNRLLRTYEGATGGKTGYTSKAGRCLVFSAERDGLELIGVVLNCYDWFDTAERMLDYGFKNHRVEQVLEAGQAAASSTVEGSGEKSVTALASRPLSAAVRQGESAQLEIDIPPLRAPIRQGQVIGTARLTCGGETIDSCELIAGQSVPAWSLGAALRSVLRNWLAKFS